MTRQPDLFRGGPGVGPPSGNCSIEDSVTIEEELRTNLQRVTGEGTLGSQPILICTSSEVVEGNKMDELIEQLTSKLGIDASTAKSATGKTLKALEDNVGGDLFSKISSSIPGVGDLISQFGESGSQGSAGGSSMLGKLAGMASSMLGEKAGSGLELGTTLAEAGLKPEKLGSFLTMIMDFIKDKAGAEVVDQVLEKFPMLKMLLK